MIHGLRWCAQNLHIPYYRTLQTPTAGRQPPLEMEGLPLLSLSLPTVYGLRFTIPTVNFQPSPINYQLRLYLLHILL